MADVGNAYNGKLRELQNMQMQIMKRIDAICEEQDIQYFIVAGTALGAVRHGGFIPWDDDVDIGMERKEYDRFVDIAQKELGDGFFLQTFWTDSNSPFYFVKVRKNGTKFVEEYCKDIEMNHGIFVDIFPYDNIPDNYFKRTAQAISTKFLWKLFIARSLTGSSVPQKGFVGILKILVRRILHFITKPMPREIFFNTLDRKMRKYNDVETDKKTCLLEKGSARKAITNREMYPLKKIVFEGVSLNTVNRTDVMLERTFGDYMVMPPKNERRGHEPYLLDLGYVRSED